MEKKTVSSNATIEGPKVISKRKQNNRYYSSGTLRSEEHKELQFFITICQIVSTLVVSSQKAPKHRIAVIGILQSKFYIHNQWKHIKIKIKNQTVNQSKYFPSRPSFILRSMIFQLCNNTHNHVKNNFSISYRPNEQEKNHQSQPSKVLAMNTIFPFSVYKYVKELRMVLSDLDHMSQKKESQIRANLNEKTSRKTW